MSFTGTPPFPGYPNYDNHGDATFDSNPYALYSGDGFGVLLAAGGSVTLPSLVEASLGADARFFSQWYARKGAAPYHSNAGPFPWGQDTLGLDGYASAPWVLYETWTVTRYTFDGVYGDYFGNGDPSGTVVATSAAPNGWDVALTLDDIALAFAGADPNFHPATQESAGNPSYVGPFAGNPLPLPDGKFLGYDGGYVFGSGGAGAGSVTVSAPGDAPYGVYVFSCARQYVLAQAQGAYRPAYSDGTGYVEMEASLLLTVAYPVPLVIQTGAASLTITNDPAFPAPGTLTGAPNEYFITGTGPVYSPSAPRPPHAVLNVKLALAGMPAETTYLGPKLLSIAVKQPPGNTNPSDGSQADLDAYKAAHPSPYSEPGAMVDYGSVLLPANPPSDNSAYEWNLPWPFYAGQLTVFFVPISYFGPVHVAPDGSTVYGWPDFNGNIVPTPDPLQPYTTLQEIGLVPPFVARLHINITPWGSGSSAPAAAVPADGGDLAQDTATGRTTKVSGVVAGAGTAMTTTLQAEAWDGWQNLAGALPKQLAPILDGAGQPAQGQYPSLWKASDEGVYSLCYQNANGQIVRALSQDGLTTLMPFPVLIFTNPNGSPRTGGRPGQLQDGSTGIYYVAAAFTLLDSTGKPTGKEDVLIARVDATDTLLRWADGTAQKTVVLGTAAAGRPALVLNRYDPAQTLLLLHGDRKFLGTLGGEQWQEITT